MFRIIDHKNADIVNCVVASLYNIILQTDDKASATHPHFEIMAKESQINKLFDVYREANSKFIKDRLALIIGMIHKGRPLVGPKMYIDVLSYIKILFKGPNLWLSDSAETVLEGLLSNAGFSIKLEYLHIYSIIYIIFFLKKPGKKL